MGAMGAGRLTGAFWDSLATWVALGLHRAALSLRRAVWSPPGPARSLHTAGRSNNNAELYSVFLESSDRLHSWSIGWFRDSERPANGPSLWAKCLICLAL